MIDVYIWHSAGGLRDFWLQNVAVMRSCYEAEGV